MKTIIKRRVRRYTAAKYSLLLQDRKRSPLRSTAAMDRHCNLFHAEMRRLGWLPEAQRLARVDA